jgi:hypothetical protein
VQKSKEVQRSIFDTLKTIVQFISNLGKLAAQPCITEFFVRVDKPDL